MYVSLYQNGRVNVLKFIWEDFSFADLSGLLASLYVCMYVCMYVCVSVCVGMYVGM